MAKITPRPELYDRLNALLQTMRCIELHEPELCSLLHEMERSKKVTPRLTADLHKLLDRIPHEGYTRDLEAVYGVLEGAGADPHSAT